MKGADVVVVGGAVREASTALQLAELRASVSADSPRFQNEGPLSEADSRTTAVNAIQSLGQPVLLVGAADQTACYGECLEAMLRLRPRFQRIGFPSKGKPLSRLSTCNGARSL
jgi:hypothetical protein